jgi:hypothetical protein
MAGRKKPNDGRVVHPHPIELSSTRLGRMRHIRPPLNMSATSRPSSLAAKAAANHGQAQSGNFSTPIR